MIPVTLRIQGFLSYREQAELSFNDFDLACISGTNGAGKSSLLDAITWVLFGKARRSDDAIINSSSETSEVVFDFEYESRLYRIQRIKPRAKTTILEFFIRDDAGNWRPLTEATMSATQERIQETLRLDYDTFINASFFLQGKADEFTQKNSSQRKEILSTILGLDVWEQYRDAARTQRRKTENNARLNESQLQEIDAELGEEDQRKELLAELEKELDQKQKQRAAQQLGFENAQKLQQALEGRQKLMQVLADQMQKMQQDVEQIKQKLDQREQEQKGFLESLTKEQDIQQRYQDWQQLRQQLAAMDENAGRYHILQQQRLRCEQEIAVAREALLQQMQFLTEQQQKQASGDLELQQLRKQQSELQLEINALMKDVEQKSSLEQTLQAEQEHVAELQAENKRLKTLMDELQGRINELQTKKESANCPLCGQPLSTAHRVELLESLQAEGTTLGDTYRKNKTEWEASVQSAQEVQKTLQALQQKEKPLNDKQRQFDQWQNRINLLQTTAQEWQTQGAQLLLETQSKLEQSDFATDAQKKMAAIEVQMAELGYLPDVHESLRKQELQVRQVEAEFHQLEVARNRLVPLEREIAELLQQHSSKHTEVATQQEQLAEMQQQIQAESAAVPNVQNLQAELRQTQLEENSLAQKVGAARQLVSVLDDLRLRKNTLSDELLALRKRIDQLLMLEEAFGKDGVPALLIEQALPEIEMQANDILDRLSAGSMSVRFETQREYKDKTRADKKQVLDILISDAAGTRPYELFSGGEAFRVNFAIRLALSKVLAQRAGARLQTLVIDEGFGSQDAEGRQRLVEAINVVRPDFAKIIVITHLEELKDVFPARIEVEKTALGSQVQVIT